MLFSQYCRIESKLGGIGSTDREFIRAALKLITAKARRRPMRAARHEWLRSGLGQKAAAEREYRAIYPTR
jgi:hypothetical protein